MEEDWLNKLWCVLAMEHSTIAKKNEVNLYKPIKFFQDIFSVKKGKL